MPVTFTPPPPPPPTIEESLEPNEVVLPTTEAAPYNEFTPDMGVVVAGVILAFVLVRVVLSLLPLILAAGLGFLAFKLF